MKDFGEKFVVDRRGTADRQKRTSEDEARLVEVQRQQRKQREKEEANLSDKEKADRQLQLEKEDRTTLARNFRGFIGDGGSEYSEALIIGDDGRIDQDRRTDGISPFITIFGNIRTGEDLYSLIQKIQQEQADLTFSFEKDENGKWIKYSVRKKQ